MSFSIGWFLEFSGFFVHLGFEPMQGARLKLAFPPFLTIELEQHLYIQTSSRHPVGHILRRLIDISQIAVQRGNFRRLQHAVSLCSLDDPFSNMPISREHLRAMDAVDRS